MEYKKSRTGALILAALLSLGARAGRGDDLGDLVGRTILIHEVLENSRARTEAARASGAAGAAASEAAELRDRLESDEAEQTSRTNEQVAAYRRVVARGQAAQDWGLIQDAASQPELQRARLIVALTNPAYSDKNLMSDKEFAGTRAKAIRLYTEKYASPVLQAFGRAQRVYGNAENSRAYTREQIGKLYAEAFVAEIQALRPYALDRKTMPSFTAPDGVEDAYRRHCALLDELDATKDRWKKAEDAAKDVPYPGYSEPRLEQTGGNFFHRTTSAADRTRHARDVARYKDAMAVYDKAQKAISQQKEASSRLDSTIWTSLQRLQSTQVSSLGIPAATADDDSPSYDGMPRSTR